MTASQDLLRTGWDPHGPALSPDVVSGGTPGQLFSSSVNGEVYAQPLACVFHAGRATRVVNLIPPQCWHPAVEDAGELREGAWVAEATGMTDLSSWPEGSRLILRKERPHPGAQLTFTDVDGHRITAFLTDTAPG